MTDEAFERAKSAYGTGAYDDATLEFLFPQLKESEDERMRKAIVGLIEELQRSEKNFAGVELTDMLAYLEKQKEQKPASTEDMPYITDEHFYEREPKDSFKYKLAEYMTKCCTKKEGPYGYTYCISAESILKMAEEELLKRGVVQKPAEWSEEDEEYFKWFDKFFRAESVVLGGKDIPQDKYLWFKSLRPQPKQEWSEEDDQLIGFIFDLLNDLVWQKDWAMSKEECLERLKSLRPSWRPSEEQMMALKETIDFAPETFKPKCLLESLYEQLKKL